MVEVAPVTDEQLAPEIARVINAAYEVGEGELWRERPQRTSADDVATRLRAGGLLAARVNGTVVGCATVRPVDDGVTELGLVSALPDQWGNGVGRELVRAAEEVARSSGTTTMQLKLLTPIDHPDPQKQRLRAWYERAGYELVDRLDFEDVSSRSAADLALPCEFLVFRKPLA